MEEIEGVVVDVMETWPLQLTVISAETHYHILLTMDTLTYLNGDSQFDYPFQRQERVHIIGQRFDNNLIVAQTIKVLKNSIG